MLISRWQASLSPSKDQLKLILAQEGLEPITETFKQGEKIQEHRHPFTEVRIICQGEMLFSVNGYQVVLRTGDRIEVPANTKHWHQAQGDRSCECLYAQRVI